MIRDQPSPYGTEKHTGGSCDKKANGVFEG